MKRLLRISGGLVVAVAVALFIISWTAPGWFFDVTQKIKYPDYYAWRNAGAAFPKKQFWIGLNTDRHRGDIFIGRTRQEIEKVLPLLQPVPADDSQLQGYISYRKIPPDRFAMIAGSMWILEFDESNRCIDIKMAKG